MTYNILIIDDEPDIRQLLSITVSRMGFNAYTAENISLAHEELAKHTFHLCLTDLRLPDGSGLDIVQHIQSTYPDIPVIVITAHGSMDLAINAMKYGAFDFINKPVDLHHLRNLINNALSAGDKGSSNIELFEIVGQSAATVKLKQDIIKVSRSQAPVLIVGESGSGKELVARAIHTHSSRKDQPFIGVNCGAIPKELVESELFGHMKGSFTGAHQDKQGLFQAANGGTLLLDEIADLPLDMQVKLLRVIQEKRIRPIGSQEEIPIDVRILSATHKNLSSAITNNSFRSDLYYRINVIEIPVPPLRARKDDIDSISLSILNKISRQNNDEAKEISEQAIKTLQQYTFPGNVRELENILERACALSDSTIIEPNDLLFPEFPSNHDEPSPLATPSTPAITTNDPTTTPDYNPEQQNIDEYLESIEKEILLTALEDHRWNRTAAAKHLGITFRSLRYRLKKLGIDIDSTP